MAKGTFSPADLRALVDMGSNGIRFSITDMTPLTARVLPTVYHDRADISLYDAQHQDGQKGVIPEATIRLVVDRLLRFKVVCQDFGVLDSNIRVLATEATRIAKNSEDFRERIKEATGWDTEMVAKEEEGRIGAIGIASSLYGINGLAMDLGGGSTQITWIVTDQGKVKINPRGSVSLPYGAAALTQRLKEAEKFGKVGQHRLEKMLREAIRSAYLELNVPGELTAAAENDGGFSIYLSGGGFRGWGYVLMSEHRIKPYPIPIVNGFSAEASQFKDTMNIESVVKRSDSIFRVSARRASQVPAVSLLIRALTEELPQIKDVRFCQGGVREGSLFLTLPDSVHAQNPLVTGTLPYAPVSSQHLVGLLDDANPEPKHLSNDLLTAFVNMMYYDAPHSKETRASAALRSTTSGVLANVHGIDHLGRAMLALMLCERWDCKVPPTDTDFLASMQQLAGPENSWWAKYFGRVAAHIAEVYPTGTVDEAHPKVKLGSSMSKRTKQGEPGEVGLVIKYLDDRRGEGDLGPNLGVDGGLRVSDETLDDIRKLGKKKKWVEGYGNKVDITIA